MTNDRSISSLACFACLARLLFKLLSISQTPSGRVLADQDQVADGAAARVHRVVRLAQRTRCSGQGGRGVAGHWRIRHKLILGLGLVVAIMALQLAGTLKGL